jgi:hypothetical protein
VALVLLLALVAVHSHFNEYRASDWHGINYMSNKAATQAAFTKLDGWLRARGFQPAPEPKEMWAPFGGMMPGDISPGITHLWYQGKLHGSPVFLRLDRWASPTNDYATLRGSAYYQARSTHAAWERLERQVQALIQEGQAFLDLLPKK